MSEKLILCIDFDGTVHEYSSPWTSPEVISDHMIDGFCEWAEEAAKHFRLVIYSARSTDVDGRRAMALWFVEEIRWWEVRTGQTATFTLEFAHEKPKAFMMIDDRGFRFEGDWSDPALSVESLLAFRPWNKRTLFDETVEETKHV